MALEGNGLQDNLLALEDNGLQVNSLTDLEDHTVVGHTQADREYIQASIQDPVRYHQGNTRR